MMMKVSSSVVLFKAENFSNDEIFFCISEGRGAASLFIKREERRKKKREKKYATIRV
jgi:hypothetical protein